MKARKNKIYKKKKSSVNAKFKKKKYIYIYIAFSYSALPYIDVHYSNEGKNFTFSSTAVAWIFVFWCN